MNSDTINDVQTIAGDGGTMLAGRYRVVRQLGQGGMGSVWLAEDTLLDNRPFAIKMLPSILVSNKRAYRQLKDEALVAMKLTHPNIVTLRAFEENGGNPFLVMDYIDGQTLDDYLCERGTGNGERGNGLSEEEAIRVLRPIAAALDYAHGEGVVHRDVKPANVMIRKDGHPFILDFGIAREIQETLTRVTGKLSSGTLLYMSPEQLNGSAPKPAQDVYSFAAMAYECLKGEPPFVRGQIDHQILACEPSPLPQGIGIAANVMKGLAKKPEDRPATCSNMLVAVRSGSDKGAGKKGLGWLWLLLLLICGGVAVGAYRWLAPAPEKDADGAPAKLLGSLPAETNRTVRVETPSVTPTPVPPPSKPVTPSPVPPKPKPSVKPMVDKEFVKLTNDLAVAVAARERVYNAAAGYRLSPRGFADQLKRIDETWNRREMVTPSLSKQKAAAALEAVKNETKQLNGWVKWMGDHKEERDAAVKQEAAFARKVDGKRAADADLFARAKQRTDWSSVQELVKTARELIDRGDFTGSRKSFAKAEKRIEDVLAAERTNREAELRKKTADAERQKQEAERQKRTAAARSFRARLDGAGFILDDKANRYPPGTAKTIQLMGKEDLVMVWCPPGWFMMGSPRSEMDRVEGEERHAVRLTKGFWIGKYEITRRQWAAVMGGSVWWGGNEPQRSISWNECKDFIRRLNNMQMGLSARLPTEAEWEYACRAGTSTPFSFGGVLNGMQACCNGGEPYGTTVRGSANMSGPSDVGSFATYANAWGLNDMHGNVYEWCEDAFADYPKGDGIVEDPMNEGSGEVRVIRGGCWNYSPRQCRSAFRTSGNPSLGTEMIGFRLVCDNLP